MDERRDRTGKRLGPYHLDKRYEGLDETGGQLYAAHHVETGRPALVLVPGPEDHWAPRSDWTARVTSQSSPPFLATELERPPPPDAEALTDVELAFIRMAGGITSVAERRDAEADFTRPPRPGGSRTGRGPVRRHMRTGALVATALVAVALWFSFSRHPERGSSTEFTSTEVTIWMTRQDSSSVIGYPMPETAFPEQAKPPCQGAEVEIRGGCWFQGKQDAPCPKGTAEYEGKCYVPVHEKKPEPRSIKH